MSDARSAARRHGLPFLAGLAILTLFVGSRVLFDAPFERVRLALFDTLQRLHPRQRTPSPVVVVDVDDESLKRHGQWPWPRDKVAELIANLQDLGAGAIGLDMIFAEPDRTSPAILVPEWARGFGFRNPDPDKALPDHDAMLAAVFARGRVVAGFGLRATPNALRPGETSIATIGGDPRAVVWRYAGAIPNLPVLEQAAAGHGSLMVSGGSDEVARRLPLLMMVGDQLVPSLALETLRVFEDEDTIKVRAEQNGSTLTGFSVKIGDIMLPLDASGSFMLHHPVARSTVTVPAWQVLDQTQLEAVKPRIAGAAVLVGTSALGLADLRPTPMTRFEPGVDLHADVIEQALTGDFLSRPAWAPAAEVAAATSLGLLACLLASLAAIRVAALAVVTLLLTLVLGTIVAYLQARLVLDPTFVVTAVLLAFAAASLVRYAGTERSSHRLRSAFTHYLSPDLVAALATDPDQLKLGGESREMTFLFTDLEGFTSLTENSGAEALVSLLNAYLDGLCGIAMEHGGTVDKIVGDALHVMFNAPLDQPDHAARAVACALALDAFGQAFSLAQRAEGVPFGVTRIGVNTGTAVVGNFGGTRRFDYTAHGDAINTAARLESANKALGTRICVASSTAALVPGQAFRPVGTLMLKGKSIGVPVFEPMAGAGEDARHALYADAFERLAAGEESAAAALVSLHDANPDDPIYALHARRIKNGERSIKMAA